MNEKKIGEMASLPVEPKEAMAMIGMTIEQADQLIAQMRERIEVVDEILADDDVRFAHLKGTEEHELFKHATQGMRLAQTQLREALQGVERQREKLIDAKRVDTALIEDDKKALN